MDRNCGTIRLQRNFYPRDINAVGNKWTIFRMLWLSSFREILKVNLSDIRLFNKEVVLRQVKIAGQRHTIPIYIAGDVGPWGHLLKPTVDTLKKSHETNYQAGTAQTLSVSRNAVQHDA